MLEIDVHMNADGELVVIHDVTVERTTNVRLAHPDRTDYSVKTMTTAEIASLDAPVAAGEATS